MKRVKADLRGWRLNRCVFVGDAGMVSAENLRALARGGALLGFSTARWATQTRPARPLHRLERRRYGEQHRKRVCELRASRRYGRYLRLTRGGHPRIDRAKVKAAQRRDGKFVVTATTTR